MRKWPSFSGHKASYIFFKSGLVSVWLILKGMVTYMLLCFCDCFLSWGCGDVMFSGSFLSWGCCGVMFSESFLSCGCCGGVMFSDSFLSWGCGGGVMCAGSFLSWGCGGVMCSDSFLSCDVFSLISVMGLWWCDVFRLISVMGLWWWCDVCRLISVMRLWWCDVFRLISVMWCFQTHFCHGVVMVSCFQEENLLDILGLAHRFVFVELETAISDYLKATLSLRNVCCIYDLANIYSLTSLCTVCKDFMDRHASDILTSEPFLALSLVSWWFVASFRRGDHAYSALWQGLGGETMHILIYGKV